MDKNEKAVYLTFDDGPIPEITPWVLDLLDRKSTRLNSSHVKISYAVFCLKKKKIKKKKNEKIKGEGIPNVKRVNQ